MLGHLLFRCHPRTLRKGSGLPKKIPSDMFLPQTLLVLNLP